MVDVAAPTHELACTSCNLALAAHGDPPGACPVCDTPTLVDRPPDAGRPAPTFAVPFVLDAEAAAHRVRTWIQRSGLFARTSLSRAVGGAEVRAIYAPVWLAGAVARATWSARIAQDIREEYEGKDGQKKYRTVWTDWFSLAGRWCDRLSVPIEATRFELLGARWPEPEWTYDLTALRRCSPALLSGRSVLQPTYDLQGAAQAARKVLAKTAEHDLTAFLPGDRHEGLTHEATFEHETVDLLLLPVWVVRIGERPGRPPLRFLVHGQTGAVRGHVPTSMRMVAASILVVVAVIAAALLRDEAASAWRSWRAPAPPLLPEAPDGR